MVPSYESSSPRTLFVGLVIHVGAVQWLEGHHDDSCHRAIRWTNYSDGIAIIRINVTIGVKTLEYRYVS